MMVLTVLNTMLPSPARSIAGRTMMPLALQCQPMRRGPRSPTAQPLHHRRLAGAQAAMLLDHADPVAFEMRQTLCQFDEFPIWEMDRAFEPREGLDLAERRQALVRDASTRQEQVAQLLQPRKRGQR